MKAAGFGQRYEAVDVRWPSEFPVEWQQALYFFQIEGGACEFCGCGGEGWACHSES